MTDYKTQPVKHVVKSFVSNRSFIVTPILSLIFMGVTTSAQAACENIDCVCKPSELQFASSSAVPNDKGQYAISLEADNVEADGQKSVTLTGNAEVAQGRQTIVADKLQYFRETDRVVATGNVEMITQDGSYLKSSGVDVHAPTHIGALQDAEFKLAKSVTSQDGIDTVEIDSRGSADVINLEGEGLIRLENARYTNCVEGKDDVVIKAKELELDQTEGIGVARNASVRFLGVPIFYTPYISFPLNDDRKTGFLTPGFGSDEDSGQVVEVPWYWNIAPNQDATITPRIYTDRGLQFGLEYRHQSKNSKSTIYAEVLPSDDLFGDDRDMLSVQHRQDLSQNWTAVVNYNDVSDTEYFDDFRNEVNYFSATYVPRDASLRYSSQYFSVNTRFNEYQIIDEIISEENAPYERLPSITLNTYLPTGPFGIKYGLEASYTDFSHASRIEGTRAALTPSISIPFENIWGYITPEVSLNHRRYSLDNVEPGAEDSPSFTVPIFSLDTGIYLEKNTSWFGENAFQTLEPRLFYAYAPEEDQDDVPIFDTSEVSLNNFSNIFRANRFYGEDRVGDTNQLTFGLTTRITDQETGDEILKASIGQLYLLDDLEQRRDNSGEPIEAGLGDLLAEIRTDSANGLNTYGFIQYDHDESEVRTARFDVGYEPVSDSRKRVSVGYYYSNRSRAVDQVTLEGSWPVSDRWQVFGEQRYSIEDSESIYTTLGLEYNACCWKLRFTGQDRVSNNSIEDKKTSFFIELELTSLGSIRSGL